MAGNVYNLSASGSVSTNDRSGLQLRILGFGQSFVQATFQVPTISEFSYTTSNFPPPFLASVSLAKAGGGTTSLSTLDPYSTALTTGIYTFTYNLNVPKEQAGTFQAYNFNVAITPGVPEPSSIAALLVPLCLLGARRRRRRPLRRN